MTISASSPMSRKVSTTRCGPSGWSYGLPRRVPSSVPPFGNMPRSERHVEVHRAAVQHTVPRVEEADQLVAVDLLALADDGPDDGVESGAVAAAGEDADTHVAQV